MRSENRPPAPPNLPESTTGRARFTRRQETLAIGWLRSFARSATSTSTGDASPTVPMKDDPADEE